MAKLEPEPHPASVRLACPGRARAGDEAPARARVPGLLDREEAEHHRLVRLAVVLPLPARQLHDDRPRARLGEAGQILLEAIAALLLLQDEVVDAGPVADHEPVPPGLELRDL